MFTEVEARSSPNPKASPEESQRGGRAQTPRQTTNLASPVRCPCWRQNSHLGPSPAGTMPHVSHVINDPAPREVVPEFRAPSVHTFPAPEVLSRKRAPRRCAATLTEGQSGFPNPFPSDSSARTHSHSALTSGSAILLPPFPCRGGKGPPNMHM